MVTAIFPAAGKGTRMKAGMNKVLLELAGVPILVRSLRRFSECPEVDQLVVVVAEHEIEAVRDMLSRETKLKPWRVVAGGSERQYSVLNGIKAVDGTADDVILVHDAARPLVSNETIEATIEAARSCGGGIAAVPAKNTIKVCDAQGVVVSTPDRATLWEIQTPQGFRRDILLQANEKAETDGFLGTDDASLVERIGVRVHIVESDYRNIKITTPEDMIVAEAFLKE